MPHLTNVDCVLAVPNLANSVAYYRDRLGFALDFAVEGWAFVSRGRFRLRLGECADAMPASQTGDHSYFAYVAVDDADALHQEFLANGVTVIVGPVSQPWGMREFGIRTPDGHRIMFGQRVGGQ